MATDVLAAPDHGGGGGKWPPCRFLRRLHQPRRSPLEVLAHLQQTLLRTRRALVIDELSFAPSQPVPLRRDDPLDVLRQIRHYTRSPHYPRLLNAQQLYDLATQVHNSREIEVMGRDPTRNNTFPSLYARNPNGLVRTGQHEYLANPHDAVFDVQSIFALHYGLRFKEGSVEYTPQFIEPFTRDELAYYEYTLDQTVTRPDTGEIVQRPPCRNGRPRHGLIGCCVYQIRTGAAQRAIEGQLGVFLSKLEADAYLTKGILPDGCEDRECVLCEQNNYTAEFAANEVNGQGRRSNHRIVQKFQVKVGTMTGYNPVFCFAGPPASAPMLAFKPEKLTITMSMDGVRRVEDRELHTPLPSAAVTPVQPLFR